MIFCSMWSFDENVVILCVLPSVLKSSYAGLCLKEKDLVKSRKAKVHEDMKDMEASLRRAKLEASLADGVSWGMDEDAIEENEVCKFFL